MKPSVKVLPNTRVHIAGMGRIGTGVALTLHAAGVGWISSNDPQAFEQEQLESYPFSRRSDLGRAKVHVLERFFDGRPGLVFTPLVAPNQSLELKSYLERADLIISCANQLEARLLVERAAVRLGKPCLQASVEDGRKRLGGLISIWAPESGCSCFGCLVPERKVDFERGEFLAPTVTNLVAGLAGHIAVQMLASGARQYALRHNIFPIDAEGLAIAPLSVNRRPSCRVCGGQ